VLVWFAASVSAQFGCGPYTYASQNAWSTVSCASSSNVCAIANGASPITVTSQQVASSGQLYSLRFSGYDDTANVLTIDGQSIIYSYTSTTATLRDLASTHGAFTPRFFSAHLPPEHQIDGWDVQPDMELQFYHSANDGTFSVVSFFFTSKPGVGTGVFSFLDPSVLAGSTSAQGVPVVGLQAFFDDLEAQYLNSYYYYEGSLTVPPCAQGVQWHLFPALLDIDSSLVDALSALLNHPVSIGGNARTNQREVSSVLYYHATNGAVSDPICGGGMPNWNTDPYQCTGQVDGSTCFYCSGRAKGLESRNMCFNRNGKTCHQLFDSDEALSYCNLAFECPASTFSVSFSLFLSLGFLLIAKFVL